MHIEEIELENFRGFNQILLKEIPNNLVVFIGINGAGKSTILDAISIMLDSMIFRLYPDVLDLRKDKRLEDEDVNHKSLLATIRIKSDFGLWSISKQRNIQNLKMELSQETKKYLSSLQKNWQAKDWQDYPQLNLPLAVYYPVNRRVSDISLETPKQDNFKQFDAISLEETDINFKDFFQWFRQREDIENEFRLNHDSNYRDKQLETVRKAILQLMPNFTNFRVRRSPPPLRLTLVKNGETLAINQLSDGEKCLITMIGDLAKRLVIANPSLDDSLQGEGIVLIDEVELHLHPQWQREIIPSLLKIFPNCQFIITTHSPQVLSHVHPENIYVLESTDEGIIAKKPESSFGRDSNSILEDIMGVPERPQEIKEDILKLFQLIDEGNLDDAQQLRQEIADKIGSDEPELIKAATSIRRREILNR